MIKLNCLKLISTTIDPEQKSFKNCLEHINKEINEIVQEIEESIQNLQFKECGDKYKILKKIQKNLSLNNIEVSFLNQIEGIKISIREVLFDRVLNRAEE